jgi:hypothetical protein
MPYRPYFEWAFLQASPAELGDTKCRLSLLDMFPVAHPYPVRPIRFILHRLAGSQDSTTINASMTLLGSIIQRLRDNKVDLSDVKRTLFSETPVIQNMCLSPPPNHDLQGSHYLIQSGAQLI